jgi:hypothetical protein
MHFGRGRSGVTFCEVVSLASHTNEALANRPPTPNSGGAEAKDWISCPPRIGG